MNICGAVLGFLTPLHYLYRLERAVGREDVLALELVAELVFLDFSTESGSFALMCEICAVDSIAVGIEGYVAPDRTP